MMAVDHTRVVLMAGPLYEFAQDPIFHQERVGNMLILSLVENPADVNYRNLQRDYNEIYRDLLQPEIQFLMFDLSRCDYLDSIVIGMLIAFTHRLRERDGNAVLVGVTPKVEGLIRRLMLLQPDDKRAMWMSYPTREAALAALPW